MNIVSRVPMP